MLNNENWLSDIISIASGRSGSRRCAPSRRALPSQSAQRLQYLFDDMLKQAISRKAMRAETDPRQGTPTSAHFEPPDRSMGNSPETQTPRLLICGLLRTSDCAGCHGAVLPRGLFAALLRR